MRKLPNIHPGEVLLEEFLTPMGISQNAVAAGNGCCLTLEPPGHEDEASALSQST